MWGCSQLIEWCIENGHKCFIHLTKGSLVASRLACKDDRACL